MGNKIAQSLETVFGSALASRLQQTGQTKFSVSPTIPKGLLNPTIGKNRTFIFKIKLF